MKLMMMFLIFFFFFSPRSEKRHLRIFAKLL